MRTWQLIWAELLHRKLNFAISLVAITAAVACGVGVFTMIHASRLRTSQRVAELDDQIRKTMKNMGFNISVLPKDQNLVDFHADDFGQQTMPYEFVDTLANSPDVVTINHLRPGLIRKISWSEMNRQVLLMGVTGIVPFAHRDPKKPLAQPVRDGTMIIGGVLANELGLRKGDRTTINGREFLIDQVYAPRFSKDDVTVWVTLAAAQDMLNLPGRINIIQALECNCATIDRLGEIRREISALLGDRVQVLEWSSKAIARAEARNHVKESGIKATAAIQQLAAVLLPTVILGACLLVAMMTLANSRERSGEVGILCAIGASFGLIFRLFMGKALMAGVLGALLGYGIGFFGVIWREQFLSAADAFSSRALFQGHVLAMTVCVTPVVTIIASWLPAFAAASQDPAVVLREE